MSQISKYPLSKEDTDRIFEIFLKTLINIKDKEEGNSLVSDFFTPTERIMLSKRLGIALLLEKGYDYDQIKSVLRVSTGTIASVSLARKYGKDGYTKFISKILKDEQIDKFIEKLTLKLVSIPAASTKGSSAWKKVKKDILTDIDRKNRSSLR